MREKRKKGNLLSKGILTALAAMTVLLFSVMPVWAKEIVLTEDTFFQISADKTKSSEDYFRGGPIQPGDSVTVMGKLENNYQVRGFGVDTYYYRAKDEKLYSCRVDWDDDPGNVSNVTEDAIMAALVDFPVLNVILAKIGGKVLGKLASILTEKVLGEFVEQIKQGVKNLGEFLQQLGDAIDKYRQQITAAKTAARQAYIAANPKISSDCLQLEETAKLMQKAIDSLNEANDALDQMTGCFLEKVVETITEGTGADIVTKTVTKIITKLAFDAIDYIHKKWGLRLKDLKKRGAMENIRKACLRISAETQDVMRGTATSLIETSFTVEPAAMLAKCKVMETTAEQLKTQKNTFQTQMDNTKGYWQGSDQEAFERDVAKLVEAADIQIQNILVRVAQVSDAMQRYQQFQDAAVQICQDNT